MLTRSNPVWSDLAIYDFRDQLTQVVPAAWLPVEEVSGTRRPTFKDYGCGHYGCVMPTNTTGLVCKVTTDVLEARFVEAAIRLKYFPDGIVRYKKIVALGGRTFKKRPVFVLWREEAYEVGEAPYVSYENPYDDAQIRLFKNRLASFRSIASIAKEIVRRNVMVLNDYKKYSDWAWNTVSENFTDWDDDYFKKGYPPGFFNSPSVRSARRVALCIRTCEVLAEYMENEPQSYLIGGAFGYYLEQGILLADVHLNNVGKVLRDNYKELSPWVITDPGHAVFLDGRYEPISILVI